MFAADDHSRLRQTLPVLLQLRRPLRRAGRGFVEVHTSSKAVEPARTDLEPPVAVTADGRRHAGTVLMGAGGIRSRT